MAAVSTATANSATTVLATSKKRKCTDSLSQGNPIFNEAVPDKKMIQLDQFPSFCMTVKIPTQVAKPEEKKKDEEEDEKDEGEEEDESSYKEFVVRVLPRINQVSHMTITSVGECEELGKRKYYQPGTMMIYWSNDIRTREASLSTSSASSSQELVQSDDKSSVNAWFTILPPAIEFEEVVMRMASTELLKSMIVPGFGDYISSVALEEVTEKRYKSDHRLYQFSHRDFKIVPKIEKMCQDSIGDFQRDNFYHWFQGIMAQSMNFYQDNNMKIIWKLLLRYCRSQSDGSLKGHPILNRAVQMNVLFFLCQQSHLHITIHDDHYMFSHVTGGSFDIMRLIIGDKTPQGLSRWSPLELGLCRWYYQNSLSIKAKQAQINSPSI